MELVAEYAERIIVINDGEIIADDNTRKIFKQEKILRSANLERPEINKLGMLINEPEILTP